MGGMMVNCASPSDCSGVSASISPGSAASWGPCGTSTPSTGGPSRGGWRGCGLCPGSASEDS
eukprot:12889234-Prorocentrum_lima.AAC.1